jgi:hypothetical protein
MLKHTLVANPLITVEIQNGTAYARRRIEIHSKKRLLSMENDWITGIRKEEEEIMNILLSSSLFGEMSEFDRQKLLRYLVTSYFHPREGENCRAHLRAAKSRSAA